MFMKILSLLPMLILISSCSTVYIVGKNFDDTKTDALVIGDTNESQVLQMLGEPFQIGQINESKVFIYSYEENVFPSHSGNKIYIDKKYKSLFIVFDDNKIVRHFTHNIPPNLGTVEMMILNEEKIKRQQDDRNRSQ